ncbi:hemerythrin domain-containing protein [Magnetospira sp. QH-2]|uniref:hemerythrin domain-containing protein n=1 Tax=Magnetospira sp. (strain QH-2) TaxID=1288970 RepID=UPI0003E818C7|nr:hemerythrin domain-containing protein [Magnetospira sp. QH-2]CCQ75273.1 protein of unknown function [Magnetospira sp. QH-2]
MIPFEKLHRENHEISELAKVLVNLVEDREICDTAICSEIFQRYVDAVTNHFAMNGVHIYPVLLAGSEEEAPSIAKRFLEGEREIKRIFSKYAKKWWRNGLHVGDHGQFLDETREMVDLVWDRVVAESEHLYPAAKKASSN